MKSTDYVVEMWNENTKHWSLININGGIVKFDSLEEANKYINFARAVGADSRLNVESGEEIYRSAMDDFKKAYPNVNFDETKKRVCKVCGGEPTKIVTPWYNSTGTDRAEWIARKMSSWKAEEKYFVEYEIGDGKTISSPITWRNDEMMNW